MRSGGVGGEREEEDRRLVWTGGMGSSIKNAIYTAVKAQVIATPDRQDYWGYSGL